MTRLLRTRARGHDERGAVLVEVVIILPVLLIIALGVFDVGLGWRASLTISSAARSGARVASNLGVDAGADRQALASVAAALGSISTPEIDLVVIYRANGTDGEVPPTCLGAVARSAGGNVAHKCNVYTAADLAAAATSAAYTGNCASSRDRFWCPANRENEQGSASGPDYLGVYVRVNHATKTKMFGSTMTIDDHAIMRLEPAAGDT